MCKKSDSFQNKRRNNGIEKNDALLEGEREFLEAKRSIIEEANATNEKLTKKSAEANKQLVMAGAVNSMNFYKGGLVTDGSTQYDSVNAKLARNEFVVNNKAVMKGNNLEFLEWLNKSNANIYDLLMQKPEHRKVLDLSDYNSTNKLNEIIANSRIYVNVDTKEMVNEIKVMQSEIAQTNKKLDSLAGVIEHKDLIVNNKIFAKDIAVRREKINNFYS